MKHPKLAVFVSSFRNEKRTYTDKATGTSREYTFINLAGITHDLCTPCILRVPDKMAGADFLRYVVPGSFCLVSLSAFEDNNGILEGTVMKIEPAPADIVLEYVPED